jgi:5-dehydro-2-deoxygluconokinase
MEGADPQSIARFKELCLDATLKVAAGRTGYGILCDGGVGAEALFAAAGTGLWIARPAEAPSSRPLRMNEEVGPDCGGLAEWPLAHVVKVLFQAHPDDPAELWQAQLATLERLFRAARRNRLELLVEPVFGKLGPASDRAPAAVIGRIYDAGIFPDWWKLEPYATASAWRAATATIAERDPQVRGVLVLGRDAPVAELEESFTLAAAEPMVKGFAVGRTIFGDVARAYFAGQLSEAEATAGLAGRYNNLCALWDAARAGASQ